jgi:cystathionine beta-lyase/cystathionine gamma-synthase
MPDTPPRIETACAHAREPAAPAAGASPLVEPLNLAAVWQMPSVEECEAVQRGDRPGYIYSRDGNANNARLEAVIAELEGAEVGAVFSTGMAAITASVLAFVRPGGRVVAASQLYGVTLRLLSEELARFGVEVRTADVTDHEAIAGALEGRADLLLVETVANPLLQVADLPSLAALCRGAGARLVVDNTFPTPCGCRPLEHGADLVVHSLTKYIGGHSDLILGAAVGSAEAISAARRFATVWGAAANPFESWLALRGVATLPLRMERSAANAAELARRLAEHPNVRGVHYPGLPAHPQHRLAARLITTGGAMLCFAVADGSAARELLRRLRLVRFAPSLGDTATTISYPAATSHRGLAPEVLAAVGVTPGLLRLSVGIDHVEDVWADLAASLPD